MSRTAVTAGVTAVLVVIGLLPATAQMPLVPEQLPDRVIVASRGVQRGAVLIEAAPDRTPSQKVVDGDAGDWIGGATRIGGQTVVDAGEHIYTDYLLDAWGADDGADAQRLALLDPLRDLEPRLERIDPLQQAAGDQFGAPAPIGALDHYGDDDMRLFADLTEVRWAVQDGTALLLVKVNQLTDPAALTVQINGSLIQDLATEVVVTADGFGGAVLEAALPLSVLDGEVSLVAGTVRDGVFVPGNAAYRPDEPVTIYSDRLQALGLADGQRFTTTVDADALVRGASQTVALGPGYHERLFTSDEAISFEDRREQGLTQHYGLFVPTSHNPATPTPATFWLHYRGGKAHSGAAWTPRLMTQLGEEVGNIVISPRGRGTSTWYVSEAHQDFFEVFADVHDLVDIDPARRYLSGYSMGGYGTWLFATLYPDLFAAGFTQSGAVTQGAWTGVGPDSCPVAPCFIEANDGRADDQLTFRALANLRHVPIAIDHGTFDELVPITGLERMAADLVARGYPHQFTRFHGYEHFTQAIVDEWADGAAYLQRFTAPANPRTVTYRVVPRLVEAVNTVTAETAFDFSPDGAYWVGDIVVRDGALFGQIDATALTLAGAPTLPVPIVGTHSGVTCCSAVLANGAIDPTNQTATFTRTGLDRIPDPLGAAERRPELSIDAVGVSSVTIDGRRAALLDLGELTVRVTSDGPVVITFLLPDGRTEIVTADAGGTTAVVAAGG
ncbi:hypothetical protein BH23ACT9_BH23ACT9_20560 [soil metagenome]